MLQFHAGLCCTESNVANLSALWTRQAGKMPRYINLFVVSELVSDVLGFIPASSPCGLRSKAGGRTEVFTAEGAEYAESENQYSFVSFVVKQFCTSTRGLALDPFSLVTHSKRQRASYLRLGRGHLAGDAVGDAYAVVDLDRDRNTVRLF